MTSVSHWALRWAILIESRACDSDISSMRLEAASLELCPEARAAMVANELVPPLLGLADEVRQDSPFRGEGMLRGAAERAGLSIAQLGTVIIEIEAGAKPAHVSAGLSDLAGEILDRRGHLPFSLFSLSSRLLGLGYLVVEILVLLASFASILVEPEERQKCLALRARRGVLFSSIESGARGRLLLLLLGALPGLLQRLLLGFQCLLLIGRRLPGAFYPFSIFDCFPLTSTRNIHGLPTAAADPTASPALTHSALLDVG